MIRLSPFILLILFACGSGTNGPGSDDHQRRWRAYTDSTKAIELADPATAVQRAQVALRMATEAGLTSEALESEQTMAYNLARMGDTAAVAILDRIVTTRAAAGDTAKLIHALRIQGDAYTFLVRMDQAAAALTRAVALATRTNNHAALASVYNSLGEVRARQGNNVEALALLQRGLAASLKSGDQDAIAVAYVTLATKQALSGNVQAAVANFDSCIVRSQKFGLPHRSAVAHANLAYLLTLQGDLPKAADHFQRAADMQEKMGDKDALSVALYGLANVLESMGEHVEAYHVFQRSLALERELGLTQRAALFEGGLAMVLLDMDSAELAVVGRDPSRKLAEALHLLNEAKAASTAMQHHEMTAGLELGIGRALLRMGKAMEAEAHLMNGTELYRMLGDRLGYARGQWHLGVWADTVQQEARALKHLTRAIEVADSTDNKEVAALAFDARHNVWRERGDPSRALVDKERAAALTEVMHNEANTAHVTRTRLNSLFLKEQEADSLEHARELADQERTAAAELQKQRNRTWLAVGVGTLALVVGALVYTIDRRRRQERVQRKTLQLEMQALRAQMNPHFLFNALASINGFIGRHDTETAKAFVARFAKLTRMVLENSRHTEVPLSKDLEALQLYLELEQVRSGNTFDFRIDVDPLLEPTDVFVPPLVLQPLVENAIWHGVANRDGRGTIVVQAALGDDRLVLSVQDDGVGRVSNPLQPSNGITDRTSLGTSITRNRLQLLAEQKGRPAELYYVDRTVGTHVELSLPI